MEHFQPAPSKKNLTVWVLGIGVFFAFLLYFRISTASKNTTLTIHNHQFRVEIAQSEQAMELGLGGRKSLGVNEGMLFIFPEKSFHYFWMKGMLFPLDFIWINGDKVIDVIPNVVPPTDLSTTNLPSFTSKQPTDKVFEINAGLIDKLEIKIGDQIQFGS